MRSLSLFCFLILAVLAVSPLQAQTSTSEIVQVSPPAMRRIEPPGRNVPAEDLEKQGDSLRVEKAYLDALDYYRAASAKRPNYAPLYNKAGIVELLMQRYKEAAKDFSRAIHADHKYAEPVNNLGVVEYEAKKYSKAVKQYERAIRLRGDSGSFYVNLGAAYFGEKDFEKASESYAKALQLDPDILERSSHNGISAQLPSPEDRARYDYIVAKLCAVRGDTDRSLLHLKRAMEEGYKGIDDVYKDPGFSSLRTDARFTELMASRPPAITEQ